MTRRPLLLVKLCFVLDCTGSMDPWIQAAKTKMEEIILNVQDKHPDTVIEVALVAYRDYGDLIRFHVIDFEPTHVIADGLQEIRAEGGDDSAEDVAGAFKRAAELSWNPSDIRMVFHIADAPAHGMEFHDPSLSDRFPEGDPDRLNPCTFLTRWATEGYDYTFVKITSKTDKMLDVFYRTYSEAPGGGLQFRVIDLRRQHYDRSLGVPDADMSELLSPAVTRAITQRISWQDM